jgi:hypothetical protein
MTQSIIDGDGKQGMILVPHASPAGQKEKIAQNAALDTKVVADPLSIKWDHSRKA